MACPFLEYRTSDGDVEFDHTRPYCGLADAFVAPVEADVCGDRFAFHHAAHCERYRRHVAAGGEAGVGSDDAGAGREPTPGRERVRAVANDANDAR